MKRSSRCLALFAILAVGTSSAQVARGTPPFGSFGGGPDVLNLGNLNVHFSIPVLSRAGRGVPFAFNLSYDTSIWVPNSSTGSWQPVDNWGWSGTTDLASPATGKLTSAKEGTPCDIHGHSFFDYFWTYTDKHGVPHPFPDSTEKESFQGCGMTTSINELAMDGSGYDVSVTGSGPGSVTWRSGTIVDSTGALTDSNGNKITVSGNQIFDTLSSTVAVLTMSGTPSTPPVKYQFTNPQGTNSFVTVNYKSYTVQTDFACGITEYSQPSIPLVDTIVMPDSSKYSFTYETTPNNSNAVTGRLASITLPTGGTISYTYLGGNHGIICADGSAAGLQRVVSPGGTWTYARSGSGSTWTTTVTSPPDGTASDVTTINFEKDSAAPPNPTNNFYETQRTVNQGSSALLATTITCYNSHNTPASCYNTPVTSPITERAVFRYLPNASGSQAETDTFFDGYGLVTDVFEYDFGSAKVGLLLRHVQIAYDRTLGNNIVDRPHTVKVFDGGSNLNASTTYTYDEGTPTASGATQLCVFGQTGCPAAGSSRGNLTTLATQANGTTTLYRKFTYYDTGMLNTSRGVSTSNTPNGPLTTYNYASSGTSCNFAFPTSITEPLTLSRSMAWDCTGAVPKSLTDENNQISSIAYSGSKYTNVLWRPYSTTDQAGNITDFTYPSATQTETTLSFNSSVVDHFATLDGLGRLSVSQTQQGPGGNYDSVETSYDALGRVSAVTLPYTAPSGGACSGTCPATSYGYDALNRVTSVTDGGTGSVTSVYTNNDVVQTVASPSTQKQLEYDGLGRLKSVCEITAGTTAWPKGTCAQTNIQTGYWTTYTYDALGDLKGVTQNAQSSTKQTRAYVYDMLGRLTSEANPETSNVATTYTYDTDTTCTGGSPAGNLVKRVDPAGNTTCYSDDQLHRALDVTYPNGTTDAKHFVYDAATVNSQPMVNVKGRLAEACTGACTSPKTVLGFSYSARGEVTDTYESTPNSGGFYHVTQSYWPNGAVNALSGLSSVPTIYYGAIDGSGLDGEGRITEVNAASGQNPVTAASYTPFGPTSVTYGSGDKDAFTFDPSTGRETVYQFKVGTQNYNGTVGWNSNGTVQTLTTVDGITGGNPNSTVTYTYDDIGRLSKASDGVNLDQTFSYDPFGNINTTGNPVWWTQTYVATNNQYQASGMCPNSGSVCYDANGNLRSDSFHIYTWDAENKLTSIDTGLTGGPVVTDAFGRVVESTISGVTQQILYGPTGKLGFANGQTMTKIRIPLPGGGQAIYNGGALAKYNHPDWQGNIRVGSKATSQTLSGVSEYTPFGYPYDNGTAGPAGPSFNGSYGDVLDSHEYDATFRELHPVQGRWIQPDPAGMAAVDVSNPQTWNRYAYVTNNPLSYTDPLGLFRCGPSCGCDFDAMDCSGGAALAGGGGGIFSGFCDASGNCGGGFGGGIDANGIPWNFGPGYVMQANSTLAWIQASETAYLAQVNQAFANAYDSTNGDGQSCDQSSGTDPVADMAKQMHSGFRASRKGSNSSSSSQSGQNSCKKSKLNQAASAAWRDFKIGEGVGAGVGCLTGVLVATGATAATDTWPLAGATVPAGCVAGGIIGVFEALPYSVIGAGVDFGLTYYGH
jgi:RHS repeat-associated protein